MYVEHLHFFRFTPLQTYKVLKRNVRLLIQKEGFTPLQTYKVLKRTNCCHDTNDVLHHYKLTRFSNGMTAICMDWQVLHHYKLTRFSNPYAAIALEEPFYTITNLQGSQTPPLKGAE